MCNPRPTTSGPRGREPEINGRGSVGAHCRHRSPPREFPSTRGYTMDRDGYTMDRDGYGMDRGNPGSGPCRHDWNYQDRGGSGVGGRSATTGHQKPSYSYQPVGHYGDRDALLQKDIQHDARTWNDVEHSERLGGRPSSYQPMEHYGDRDALLQKDKQHDARTWNDVEHSERLGGRPSSYQPVEHHADRDALLQKDIQHDARTWNDVEHSERFGGREYGHSHNGERDRFLSGHRGRFDRPAFCSDNRFESATSSKNPRFENSRGYSQSQVQHRRHGDVDRRPGWEGARVASRHHTYADSCRPGVRDVILVPHERQLPPSCLTAEAPVPLTKKHFTDRRGNSPPRKRFSPTEKMDTPSPSKVAPTGLGGAALTTTNMSYCSVSTDPKRAGALLTTAAQKGMTGKEPSICTTTNTEARIVSSRDLNSKGELYPATKASVMNTISSSAPASVKEETGIVIPARWLIPANRSKTKVPIKKEAPKEEKKDIAIPVRWLTPNNKGKVGPNKETKKTELVGALSTAVIPRRLEREAAPVPPSHISNRMVTDSEGGSTASNSRELLAMAEQSKSKHQVPAAIVTTSVPDTRSIVSSLKPEKVKISAQVACATDLEETACDEQPPVESISSHDHSDSSDTDDDELRDWANKMFGTRCRANSTEEKGDGPNRKMPLKLRLKLTPSMISYLKLQRNELKKVEKAPGPEEPCDGDPNRSRIKLKERGRAKKNKKSYLQDIPEATAEERELDEELQRIERQEEKRIREEAKPLTAAQIRKILGEDDFEGSSSSNWVRRSVRQPSKALLNSKPLNALVAGLKSNQQDMVVLKMKKYINDPDAPSCVLDAALEALEENSNCEALYIQVGDSLRFVRVVLITIDVDLH
jgi:hypothetical protein